jgi:hypothetical protein
MNNGDVVGRCTNALTEVFERIHDKHEAHYRSRSVLSDMAGDASFLGGILRKHLAQASTLNTKLFPVLEVPIAANPHYTLVANCWIPLPTRETDVTTKAIHHHGNMLLTTVTAYGPGYEHWTFTRPEPVDPVLELYTMTPLEHGPHPFQHAAFVDAYIAHVPLFAPSLSITLALWSNQSPTTWRDAIKRLPLTRGREASLRRLATRVGLTRALDLKTIEYFDFYPVSDGFKGMKNRIEFERGPNADYLQSLFHIIQQTGNEALAPLVEAHVESAPLPNTGLIRQLLKQLRGGRSIEPRLSPCHFGVPHANFKRADIERALAAQTARR